MTGADQGGSKRDRLVAATAFTQPARPGTNLDRIVTTEDFAAVFDGATPKHDDIDGARRATAALVDELVGCVRQLPSAASWPAVLAACTAAATPHAQPFGPSAAGAIFSRHLSAVLVIGDAWMGLDGRASFHGHLLESILARLRQALMLRELADGRSVAELAGHDPGRRAILPLLAAERLFRNVDAEGACCFAGIDGRPIPFRLVTVLEVPAATRQLVLATDGYPQLGDSWDSSERALAERLRRDPLLVEDPPATKGVRPGAGSYDDRSYLSLRLIPRGFAARQLSGGR